VGCTVVYIHAGWECDAVWKNLLTKRAVRRWGGDKYESINESSVDGREVIEQLWLLTFMLFVVWYFKVGVLFVSVRIPFVWFVLFLSVCVC
jgi:hypothetical protein